MQITVYNDNVANSAPSAWWGELLDDLQKTPVIVGSDLTIYLNENGEYCNIPTAEVAAMIAQGGIWIDWCGWPFYYNLFDATMAVFGPELYTSPDRFGNLVQHMGFQLGYGSLGYPVFDRTPPGYEYLRALKTTGPVDMTGFTYNSNTPPSQSGSTYIYPSFAIRYGKGAYIYAMGLSHDPTNPFDLADAFGSPHLKGQPVSVTPDQYVPFVRGVIQDVLGYKLTPKSGPGCSEFGAYKGENAAGHFVYQRVQNGQTIQTIVDDTCTPIQGGVSIVKSPTVSTPVQSAGGSGRGLCAGQGTYVGPGNLVGSSEEYDAYRVDTSNGYTYNIVDPTTCSLIHSYPHVTKVSASTQPVKTTGVAASQPSSGAPTTAKSTFFTTQNMLLLGGGLVLAGGIYYYATRGR